ncbi:MAG: DUF1624 domain-containing protein [Candidatus Aureabacteria bacterium]|nr:DUF1624 domain-containing protein [Candidatus Auribacterota bacterium]
MDIKNKRLISVDIARGIVMIIMACDHVSFFWNSGRVAEEGLRGHIPHYLNIFQMLTRIISHFTPTSFIWLAGFMVALSAFRKSRDNLSETSISKYLTLRGLLIIFLQISVVNFGFMAISFLSLNLRSIFFMDVLWTIGMGLIILAWLRLLGKKILLVILFLNFMVFPLFYEELLLFSSKNDFLLSLGIISFAPIASGKAHINCLYPIIPWLGVMLFGYLSGSWFKDITGAIDGEKIFKKCINWGLGLLSVFFFLRFFNGYGNWIKWDKLTFQDFFTISKYPPSLVYLLFTLGLMFLVFAIALKIEKSGYSGRQPVKMIIAFGRVPLFFYCVHLLLYGAIPVLLGICQKGGLIKVYLIWFVGLLILYKPCIWYYNYKKSHRDSFFRYI